MYRWLHISQNMSMGYGSLHFSRRLVCRSSDSSYDLSDSSCGQSRVILVQNFILGGQRERSPLLGSWLPTLRIATIHVNYRKFFPDWYKKLSKMDILLILMWIIVSFALCVGGGTSPSHTHPLVLSTSQVLSNLGELCMCTYAYCVCTMHCFLGFINGRVVITMCTKCTRKMFGHAHASLILQLSILSPLDENPKWRPVVC